MDATCERIVRLHWADAVEPFKKVEWVSNEEAERLLANGEEVKILCIRSEDNGQIQE